MSEVSIPYAVVGAQARQRGCRFPRSALIDRAEERWHDGDRDSTPFRRPVRTAAFTNSRGTVKLRCNAYPPDSRRTASCTAGRRRGSRIRVWPSVHSAQLIAQQHYRLAQPYVRVGELCAGSLLRAARRVTNRRRRHRVGWCSGVAMSRAPPSWVCHSGIFASGCDAIRIR